uniref:hypothetical protein n=2 Tax=Salmonella enterica TaxID=28901 RepID=UPI0015C48FB3
MGSCAAPSAKGDDKFITTDYLQQCRENFATLRRYTPALLEVLELRAAPAAQGVLAAVQTLREMNADNLRKVPADAPT